MKKLILLLSCVIAVIVSHAQLNLQASVAGGYNLANNFGAFRNKYNEVNGADLKNNLGNLKTFTGYNIELNYRIMGLACGLSRTYLHSGTSAKFNNGAKRLMDLDYKLSNVFIGGGFNLAEKSEIRIEVGMVHAVSDLYSFVKYPSGEIDYGAGGVSHQSTHTNIGLAARISFHQSIGDKLLIFGSVVYNRLNADNTDIAPFIDYMETKVTHTFSGVFANVGLGYKIITND